MKQSRKMSLQGIAILSLVSGAIQLHASVAMAKIAVQPLASETAAINVPEDERLASQDDRQLSPIMQRALKTRAGSQLQRGREQIDAMQCSNVALPSTRSAAIELARLGRIDEALPRRC